MAELVAEIGSSFVAMELGLPNAQNMTNHAAYVQSWLQAMENDPKFIFDAASQASKATDFLLSFSRTVKTAEESSVAA